MRLMQAYDTSMALDPLALLNGTHFRTEARLVTAWKQSFAHRLVRAVASVFRERTYGGYDSPCSAPSLSSWHHGAWHHEKLLSGEKPAEALSL